jgi:hypothetical protein
MQGPNPTRSNCSQPRPRKKRGKLLSSRRTSPRESPQGLNLTDRHEKGPFLSKPQNSQPATSGLITLASVSFAAYLKIVDLQCAMSECLHSSHPAQAATFAAASRKPRGMREAGWLQNWGALFLITIYPRCVWQELGRLRPVGQGRNLTERRSTIKGGKPRRARERRK